ncbi:MAG: DUF1343 domain-containing protein, partial [Bacteroidota bacterium]
FLLMQVHNSLYPEKNPFSMADLSRLGAFDLASGTDQVRKLFTQRMSYNDIKEYLEKGVQTFRKKSSKYFLYY